MAKHTPGPWKTIPSPHGRKYQCVQFGADEMYTSLEMRAADARLVAAAPDLLAIVKSILGWADLCECGEPFCRTTLARAAIAKAEGSPSPQEAPK